jgi:N-acyl-D-amino-acid deacylase
MKVRLVIAVILTAAAMAPAAAMPVTGQPQPALSAFDRVMVDFLQSNRLPGATLAVTRGGRLVYARGFGWADLTVPGRPVEVSSLFRIASDSKMFTAAAVLRLVEEGKLSLDDHPFVKLGLPPFLAPGQKLDPRIWQITVLELLQHRGGFDRKKTGDPMYQTVHIAQLLHVPPPASPQDIIRYMEGRPLDFDPGQSFAYSNFGYCVLGRLIEQASGESYAQFVAQNILQPLGIGNMRQGRSLIQQRAPGEVTYYTAHPLLFPSVFAPNSTRVPIQYGGFYFEAHDSCGGWLGTAADMVSFASSLDDPRTCPVLSPASIALMFRRPPGPAGLLGHKPGALPSPTWYGCGWVVLVDPKTGHMTTSHAGLLYGTSSLVVRRWDGVDYAVVFNQERNATGTELSDLIAPLLRRAIDGITNWPIGLARSSAWPGM